ncbi:cache domain-containing protein [Caldimonas thermodepolymerans]|uniref:cache domain-containing protein n=1 Tax=Caldimonas thermodepolymerans TaxID=215580 RepID=UPI0022363CAC|nr:cache domain-containing protein [Caldimonas thermodepolymerans]UZG43434.1 cache domain-containing protein [Caldimonas thermodepolymerans]
MKFERLSIRAKLLWMVLLPLVVVLPLLGVILLGWSNTAIDRLLVTKVRSDLAVARGYFDRVLDEVSTGTDIAAQSHPLHLALAQGRPEAMQDLLERFRQRAGLDFLNVYDASGRLVAASWGLPEQPRLALDRVPLSDARPAASVELLQPEEVAGIAPPLVGRLGIPLVPTEGAAPTDRQVEHRALVVLATAPVLDADGRLLAQVRGGVLLNRNLAFIDHINEIVYPEGSLPFGSQGTATLFLEDVRITTNVRLFGNERAIGTRVSQAVRDAVLGRGSTWLDRAFVVNDWYVSGYEPLQDRQGRRVGMLYVGFLERPFTLVKYAVLAGIGIVFFGVMIGAAWVSLRLARGIFQPLEQMARTMREVEGGNAQARVGEVASQDEIGQLAGHLDHLLVAVDEKTRALQRWGEELDRKVAERTRDLERAQQQLVRSEKLAAIGQLTASVAHEVNNPIAVIQGNLDLVRELLGPDAKRVAAELKLMDEQIERMRLIVTQLLQFARPTEYAGYVESVDVHQALEASLVLVGHMLSKTRIKVERDFRATRTVGINRQELQQVLINLIVNAVQAMPGGGVLRLATRDWEDLGVVVQVADTGPGLSEELLAELFQPFVTRKKDGTGLGLWISRSIVERYGGDLRGENRPEGGAVFSLRVRGEPVEAAG